MFVIQEENYLYHAGVKGMKWGVVTEEKQAKREVKAQKFDAKVSDSQKQIDMWNARKAANPKNRSTKYEANSQISELKIQQQKDKMNADRVRKGQMTTNQRRIAVGVALVATYATYKFVDSGNARQMITRGKDFMDKQTVHEFKKKAEFASKDLDADGIMKNVVHGINPNYGLPGTKMNCRRATFAYEMRRRGYDVQATHTIGGTGQTIVGLHNAISPKEAELKGGMLGTSIKVLREKRAGIHTTENFLTSSHALSKVGIKFDNTMPKGESILTALKINPDGARGELGMVWKGGGGHSMAWEIVKGKPVIFDTQSGKKYQTAEDLAEHAANMASVGFTRLDDVKLNTDFLTKWVKNV